MKKVKAGLILLSAKWFLDVGIQNNDSGRYSELPGIIDSDTKSIIKTLERNFEIIYPGPVYSLDAAQAAVRKFKTEGIDLMILVHLMWSEDGPLVKILKEVREIPVLLWCYNPYHKLPEKMRTLELFRSSGAVGILQGSAPMRRMGIPFSYIFGYPGDERLDKELEEYAGVFKTAAGIKKLRIGQIAPRCEPMTGTYVDEFRLISRLGPTLVPISAYRLYEVSAALSDSEVDRFVQDLKTRYRVFGVSDKSLHYAARASMAVERLVEEEGLGAIAIEDLNPELHKLLKTRPCLWTPGLRDKKAVVGMEADVVSTIGMWIARQLGESTPMYTEIFTYDQEENALLMGHAAMHDTELAGENEITLIPDYEYEAADEVEGAWLHFTAKAGPVTVISTFADIESYRMLVFKGGVLPVKDKLEGFSSAYVKIGMPLHEFFEKAVRMGMTQHFAVSYDDLGAKLEKFCSVVGIEYINHMV